MTAVLSAEGRAEEGAGEEEHGPKGFAGGPLKFTWGSEGPAGSPALNEWQCPDVPGWLGGGRVSLALGLSYSKSPVFRGQALCDWPLGGRPKVRLSPQDVVRPDPMAVR